MRYFKRSEFDCKCCGVNHMQDEPMVALDEARHTAGVPFVINSGYRCLVHNASKAVGGLPDSSHIDGWAADIEATTSRDRFLIIESLIKANFHRIGIAKTFIHADMDPVKSGLVAWLY